MTTFLATAVVFSFSYAAPYIWIDATGGYDFAAGSPIQMCRSISGALSSSLQNVLSTVALQPGVFEGPLNCSVLRLKGFGRAQNFGWRFPDVIVSCPSSGLFSPLSTLVRAY
jgi:hypothetical protein